MSELMVEVRKEIGGYLSGKILEAYESVPVDCFGMSEDRFMKELRPSRRLLDNRRALWADIARCQMDGGIVNINRMLNSIGSKRAQFYAFIDRASDKELAFLFSEPVLYREHVDGMLETSTQVLRDELDKLMDKSRDMPLEMKELNFVKSTYQMLHEMMHGKAVQRNEVLSMNVEKKQGLDALSDAELQLKLEELSKSKAIETEIIDENKDI